MTVNRSSTESRFVGDLPVAVPVPISKHFPCITELRLCQFLRQFRRQQSPLAKRFTTTRIPKHMQSFQFSRTLARCVSLDTVTRR
jgi:hypothetical protein